MNVFKRPGIYAGLTGLVLISAAAAPALAQTKTFPPGTDCSQLTGADMAACQNQMSSQQRDGTVGNGATPGAPVAPGGIGSGNQVPPATNGGVNNLSTNPSGGVQNNGATNNSNGGINGTNSNGTKSNGTSNP